MGRPERRQRDTLIGGGNAGLRAPPAFVPLKNVAVPSRPLRLVVVNTEFHTGGAESSTARVFTAISQRGHKVDWCALYRPGPTGTMLATQGQSIASGFMRGRADLAGFLKAAVWLRAKRPDVVWFIAQPATVFWAQMAARLAGAACVAAVHNTIEFDALSWRHPYRWMFRFIDQIVCVAEHQRHGLLESARLSPSRVCRIYNGVDAQEVQPAQRGRARQALRVGEGEIVAGMVARLYPIKGVDIFIRAARLCLDQDPRLRFVVIGDGPEGDVLRRLVGELGLQDRVLLFGHRDDVQDILPGFDIGVLSSRSEALPMGLLEYMAAGLPVVATKVGSVEELVVSERTGLLVDPKAPQMLADAILRLSREPEFLSVLGEAGRRRAQQFFSLESTVRETEALCRSLQLARSAQSH